MFPCIVNFIYLFIAVSSTSASPRLNILLFIYIILYFLISIVVLFAYIIYALLVL